MSRPAARTAADNYARNLGRGAREAILLLAAAITIYLLMALLSYTPTDPGWSSRGNTGEIANLGGAIGAWCADVLLSLFGWTGYVLPWLVLYAGWTVYRRQENGGRAALAARGFALLVFVFASCGLAGLYLGNGAGYLPQTSGGIVGSLVARATVTALNRVGALWFLLTLCGVALSVGIGFSWLHLMERIGGATLWLGGWLLQSLGKIWSVWRSRKTAVERTPPRLRAAQAERVERREPPPRRKRAEPNLEEVRGQLSLPVEPEPLPFAPGESPLPPLELLEARKPGGHAYTEDELTQMSAHLERQLADFDVEARVVNVEPGPVITRFELEPASGVRVNQISNLAKDLARALSVLAVRVVEVIPGKPYVGLEIPNQERELVSLREILESTAYQQAESPLTLALGKDISGVPVVADLARMPHLLVAGTTGSGKSVALNVMILSILFRQRPEDVRLIMIDPKMLELSVYEGIPHLLAPVVTDMKEAANALRWCVVEMDRRYRLMSALGVRNLAGFNRKLADAEAEGEAIPDPLYKPELAFDPSAPAPALLRLPHVVVIVDELADLMMVVGKKVEELITRLAQKARAAGIHLILATQRPSVDVITGLIKANIPTRIAFQVSARVDSRTILDQMGAESLVGQGDMLYLPPGTALPRRVHGAFVDDHEVHKLVAWLKRTGPASYLQDVVAGVPEAGEAGEGGNGGIDGESDPLYDEAVKIVTESRKASISWVQRRLRIGYNRAARLVEQMEAAGIVGPLEANGSREILAPPPPEL
ncbi:MAG: DNA translocase FtsK [Nevskiales bacterium]